MKMGRGFVNTLLNGFDAKLNYPAHLRRIRFNDPETGTVLVFLSNQMTLPAATTCALYRSRRQVDLFVKWMNQFLGTSENAVNTQIWIVVAVYTIIRK